MRGELLAVRPRPANWEGGMRGERAVHAGQRRRQQNSTKQYTRMMFRVITYDYPGMGFRGRHLRGVSSPKGVEGPERSSTKLKPYQNPTTIVVRGT